MAWAACSVGTRTGRANKYSMRFSEFANLSPRITPQSAMDADALWSATIQRNAELKRSRDERRKKEMALQRQHQADWKSRHARKLSKPLFRVKKRKRNQRVGSAGALRMRESV